MTRDPSDGSVKEQTTQTRDENPIDHNALLSTDTSGLREPGGKPDYLARLQRSRQWLADRKLAT